MSVYANKRSGKLYIQFSFRSITYKKYLPAHLSREEAKQVETKWRHDLFLAEQGMLPPDTSNELWERFVADVYLEHVAANQSAASLERLLTFTLNTLRRINQPLRSKGRSLFARRQ